MSRFIYFFQSKGVTTLALHFGIGTLITAVLTVLGIVSDRLQILGGAVAKICLWQPHFLWLLIRSDFVERYEDGSQVYAGLPFLIVSLIGMLSGIPIYTLLSMLVHYVRRDRSFR